MASIGPRLQVGRREALQPGVLVGGEHREGRAALGHHLVALEDDLVLEIHEGKSAAARRRFTSASRAMAAGS
jgi:hypothetical protein